MVIQENSWRLILAFWGSIQEFSIFHVRVLTPSQLHLRLSLLQYISLRQNWMSSLILMLLCIELGAHYYTNKSMHKKRLCWTASFWGDKLGFSLSDKFRTSQVHVVAPRWAAVFQIMFYWHNNQIFLKLGACGLDRHHFRRPPGLITKFESRSCSSSVF
jgi:hypothetical protein